MNEVQWQKKIVDRLQAEGCFSDKWATQLKSGPPDLIIVDNKDVYFFEVKLVKDWGGRKKKVGVTSRQMLYLGSLRQAGAKVGVLVVITQKNAKPLFYLRNPIHGELRPHQDIMIGDWIEPEMMCYQWEGPNSGNSLIKYIRRRMS